MTASHASFVAAPAVSALTGEARVSDALTGGVAVAQVFLRRGMACPGCAMAPFVTIAEAARSYREPLDQLLSDLRAASDEEPTRGTSEPTHRGDE